MRPESVGIRQGVPDVTKRPSTVRREAKPLSRVAHGGLIVIMAVWLFLFLAPRIGTASTKDANGNVVSPYDQAKETLLWLGGFVTLGLGYWFGSKESEAAKSEATAAKGEAETAKQTASQAAGRADKAERQVEAIREVAPDAVQRAADRYGDIFGRR